MRRTSVQQPPDGFGLPALDLGRREPTRPTRWNAQGGQAVRAYTSKPIRAPPARIRANNSQRSTFTVATVLVRCSPATGVIYLR